MENAISINTMDEYIGELTSRFNFDIVTEKDIVIMKVPDKLGSGYMKMQQVSDDISIGIMDLYLKTPLVSYYDSYENTCEVTYCLAGHVSYSETGLPKANLGKNEVGVYAIPRTRGMMLIPSGERVFLISVVAKKRFYQQLPFVSECQSFENQHIKDALCRMAKPIKITPNLHSLFSRIMKNDISEPLRSTYLDSTGKVMLSDIWNEYVVHPFLGKESINMSAFNQNALMDAKKILTEQYLSPPTIQELSKQIALNEYSLKTGFKLLFGTSVFGYVRQTRMENAKYLLENDSLSIGQIAAMVGYVNASHFARAFRNEYGVNPKDLRFRA